MSDYDNFIELKAGKATLEEIALTLDKHVSSKSGISAYDVIKLIEKAPSDKTAFKHLHQMENACNKALIQPHREENPSDKKEFEKLGNWIQSRILSLR